MITKSYQITIPHASFFTEGWCLIDIVTEGRYWRTSKLLGAYAIECGSTCTEYEWLAEREADEYDILAELSRVLKNADHIVTFNGTSFDLPHLKNKYKAYRASDPVSGRAALDLVHALKPYRFLFGLTSYHLTDYLSLFGSHAIKNDAEGALHISSLLDLSHVFDAPVIEPDAMLVEKKLPGCPVLMTGCATATRIRSCADEADFTNLQDSANAVSGDEEGTNSSTLSSRSFEVSPSAGEETAGGADSCLVLKWQLPKAAPINFDFTDEVFHMEVQDNQVRLEIAAIGGMLRRYYPDPANYEFLLAEGYAAHKSLTAYVSDDRKTKAVRENCYSLIPLASVYPGRPERLGIYVKTALSYLRREIPQGDA